MHDECTKLDLINNIREKLNDFIKKTEIKFDDINTKYHYLSTRTELQEKDITSIKDDVKVIKTGMNEIYEKINLIESKDSKRAVAILTGLSLNLLVIIGFMIRLFFFGGAD